MNDEPTPSARPVLLDDLRTCLAHVFARLGLGAGDAAGMADLLMDSELRGHPDHGVAALGILGDFYGDGMLNPTPDVQVVAETPGSLLLDGDRGGGPRAPEQAMRWCVDHAREQRHGGREHP
jgi:LDH2 family malate/lactate/ureidoglycolate dehydrogenase